MPSTSTQLSPLRFTHKAKMEFDTKGMPFRRLGGSGLRVPLLSLGACTYAS